MSSQSPLANQLAHAHGQGGWEAVAKVVEGMAPTWQPIDSQRSVYPYEAGLIHLWHRNWERGVSVGFYTEATDSWWLVDDDGSTFGVGIPPSHWQPLPAPPANREAT